MEKFFEITEIRIYFTVILFFLGAAAGSFVDCLAWRISRGLSAVKSTSSICDYCGHRLKATDLIPIFSYIMLKGKCKYCGNKLPVRHFLTELISAIFFAGVFNYIGPSVEMIKLILLYGILLTAALIDAETRTIPNVFFILITFLWPVFLIADGFEWRRFITGIVSAAMITFLLLAVTLILDKITGKDSFGGGDIKLIFSICLYLNIFNSLVFLLLMSVSGLIYAAILKKGKKESFPFGPEIALSAITVLIFSDKLAKIF